MLPNFSKNGHGIVCPGIERKRLNKCTDLAEKMIRLFGDHIFKCNMELGHFSNNACRIEKARIES